MKRFWFLVPVACVGALIYWWDYLWRKVAYNTGSYNTPGTPHNYNANSGFLSIVVPWLLQMAGAVALLWWHTRCHVTGCYWPGLPHKTAAGHKACWRHHPERRLTHAMLHERHHAAVGPVSAGTGSNPVSTVGLNADRPVVPPAAATPTGGM